MYIHMHIIYVHVYVYVDTLFKDLTPLPPAASVLMVDYTKSICEYEDFNNLIIITLLNKSLFFPKKALP